MIPVGTIKNGSKIIPVAIAAVLFGTATPVIKLLLSFCNPLALASFLYLGAGAGIFLFSLAGSFRKTTLGIFCSFRYPSRWLIGTIITGGIIAPAIQFAALSVTPAAMAALLLNFEIIATALFAWGVFHERVSRNLLFAIIMVLSGSLVLSLDTGSVYGFSLGAAGIIFSCIFWGLDNNLMGKINPVDPADIVVTKGLAGGGVLFLAMIVCQVPVPGPEVILAIMFTGFFTFGFGLVFLIASLRGLGAARTGAYFAFAPFIGAFSSLFLFMDVPGMQMLISVPLFVAGVVVLLTEQCNPHWTWRKRQTVNL
jgi:drug/metabolite transporter (DMT)-like permease